MIDQTKATTYDPGFLKFTPNIDIDIFQRGRISKYRYLYERIDREMKNSDTLVIENAGSINEAKRIIAAIRRHYPNMKINLRKYTAKGVHSPSIYLRKY